MKIQNDAVNVPLPAQADAAVRVSHKHGAHKGKAENEQPAADTAQVSAIARQIEADPARLDRLREAVRNGTYSAPAHEVSAKLIDEQLDPLNPRS